MHSQHLRRRTFFSKNTAFSCSYITLLHRVLASHNTPLYAHLIGFHLTPTAEEQKAAIEECPDICMENESMWFFGNMAHPTDNTSYVACWHGVAMGCGKCPEPRYFDSNSSACLWPGGLRYDPKSML